MPKRRVRFVGGPAHGETMNIEPVDLISVPEMPDLPAIDHTKGQEPCNEVVRQFDYQVHKMNYATGHSHFYAFPRGVPVVQGMNMLWEYASGVRRRDA